MFEGLMWIYEGLACRTVLARIFILVNYVLPCQTLPADPNGGLIRGDLINPDLRSATFETEHGK